MTTRARIGLAGLGVLFAAVFVAAAQDQTQRDSSLSGRVIDGVTGKGIVGVEVSARLVVVEGSYRSDDPRVTSITTADGAFTIVGVPTGRVMLGASMRGYFDGQLGPNDDRPSGSSLFAFEPDKDVKGVVIKLWPYATVSGVLEDEARQPIVGAYVQLLTQRSVAGESRISSAGILNNGRTDDRGRYQLGNIRPGRYFVVSPRPSRPAPNMVRIGSTTIVNALPTAPGYQAPIHPTVFYPSSPSLAGAIPVTVGPGDALEGINLTVPTLPPSRARSISGRLVGREDRVASMAVTLVPADSPEELWNYEGVTITANERGAFRFAGLPPGQYRIVAYGFPRMETQQNEMAAFRSSLMERSRGMAREPFKPLPDEPTLWADVPVTLDARDIDDLPVNLQHGARLRGRLVFDGAAAKPGQQELVFTLVSVSSTRDLSAQMPQSRVEGDGSFLSAGVPPGRYGLTWRNAQPGLESWRPVSLRVAGVERTTGGVEVGASDLTDIVMTLSDKTTALTGTVHDSKGNPTSEARVVLFPRDQRRWTEQKEFPFLPVIQSVIVNRAGRFSATVAPGEYVIAAVSTIPANWMSTEFLHAVTPLGVRTQVTPGQTADVTVQARPAP